MLYRFRFRAKNMVGWGEFSDESFIQAATKPIKPPAPQYKESDDTSITINFASTIDDGGSPILLYKLYADDGNDFTSSYHRLVLYNG